MRRIINALAVTAFCLLTTLISMSPVVANSSFSEHTVHDLPSAESAPAFIPLYMQQLNNLEEREQDATKQPVIVEHNVRHGETLISIAARYETTVSGIVAINGLSNPHLIEEGEVLLVLDKIDTGVLHELSKGETIWHLSVQYDISVEEIMDANNIDDPRRLEIGQEIVVPGVGLIAASGNQLAGRTGSALGIGLKWPVDGWISSGYGPRWGSFHYGLDIAANTGTPIKAAAAGTVTVAGWRSGYGYMVKVDHGNGWETLYAHASQIFTSQGQHVRAGQTIAAVGQTGNATGPHLHFEVMFDGENKNPKRYLP